MQQGAGLCLPKRSEHAVWAQIERDEFLRPFQSYINRYRAPYEQSYSRDPLYYSLNVGRAHAAPRQSITPQPACGT